MLLCHSLDIISGSMRMAAGPKSSTHDSCPQRWSATTSAVHTPVQCQVDCPDAKSIACCRNSGKHCSCNCYCKMVQDVRAHPVGGGSQRRTRLMGHHAYVPDASTPYLLPPLWHQEQNVLQQQLPEGGWYPRQPGRCQQHATHSAALQLASSVQCRDVGPQLLV